MVPDSRSWAEALYSQGGDSSASSLRAMALESVAETMAMRDGCRLSLTSLFFNDPGISAIDKAHTLASMIQGDEQWAAFTTLLVRRKSTGLIPAISSRYRALLDKQDNIERVVLETARPLEAETRKAILNAWTRVKNGSTVIAVETVKPELLGGFRFNAGSVRYDASIAGRLQRLRADLARPLARSASGDGGTA